MKIIEKEYPTGKNAMCGDIIITNDNEYGDRKSVV